MIAKLTVLVMVFLLTNCNLTVNPDGTRNWSLNSEIARAIIVQATK